MRVNQHSVAEHRLAHIRDQDVRDNAHAGHDRDIDLGMAEEPEQDAARAESIRRSEAAAWSLMTSLEATKKLVPAT